VNWIKQVELGMGQWISYISYIEFLGSNYILLVGLSQSVTEREIALYFLEIQKLSLQLGSKGRKENIV
jgi:hypothetical protein